jgi:hypothetical protein
MKRMKTSMMPHVTKGLTKREKNLAKKGAEKRYTATPGDTANRQKEISSALIRGF